MIFINFNMIAAGLLLFVSGVVLHSAQHTVLGVIDMGVAMFILWNSIQRIDPPSGGDDRRFKMPAYGA